MENGHTVYFNMCHHYRKTLNAKPRVDTALPKSLQTKENKTEWKSHREKLIPRSKTPILDNGKLQTELRSTNTRQYSTPVICQYYYKRHFKDKFENTNKPVISSTIKKNNKNSAQSMLRSSHIHNCPSREKQVQMTISNETNMRQEKQKERNIQNISANNSKTQPKLLKPGSIFSINSYSGESSEDSAYNEGECNLSCDSRGSSPQCAISKKVPVEQISVMKSQLIPSNTSKMARNKKEDIVCIQFLKDITHDILKKNIFTNQALRSVFQQHVKLNKYDLQIEKMLIEVAKLKERLGVPEDDKFDDEDYGLGKINLDDSTKNEMNVDGGLKVFPSCTSSLTIIAKNKNDVTNREVEVKKDHEQDNYSDNFSEENSYSESSPSPREKSNSSNRESSAETNDEVVSEIEEDAQEVGNEDKFSDIEENISYSESDSEILETPDPES